MGHAALLGNEVLRAKAGSQQAAGDEYDRKEAVIEDMFFPHGITYIKIQQ